MMRRTRTMRTRVMDVTTARGQEMYTERRTEGVFYRLSRLSGEAYERTGWLGFDKMALLLWRMSQVDADAVYALVMLMAGCMAVGLLLGMYSVAGADGMRYIMGTVLERTEALYEATRAYIGM